MKTLVWLRNDLRLSDNPALFHAVEESSGIVVVYIFCEQFVLEHETAPVRLEFVRQHLQLLKDALARLNIPLVLLRVKYAHQIPEKLFTLAQNEACEQLYFNAEYPLDELNRDQKVTELFQKQGLRFKRYHDRVVLPPGSLRNGKGEPYKVFTAFKRSWLERVQPLPLVPQGLPASQSKENFHLKGEGGETTETLFADVEKRDLSSLWPAGEDEAHKRLKHFIENQIDDYQKERDFPSLSGTSELSPYLAVGSISPRQCLSAALRHLQGDWESGSKGAHTWIGELIWRDFYQHVVVDFPWVCKRKALQRHTEAFPWRRDRDRLSAWQEGRTGIPMVDAAMRQLRETGWMHNRLRMVVAMFLTKNLQIDWRAGESWFMSQLVDGDFAANNGGWQWSASTGTDAAPYFRIFNPVTQAERFDPEGEFIRRYVVELKNVPGRGIHQPQNIQGYPQPIVDLKASRKHSIELFKQLNESQNQN